MKKALIFGVNGQDGSYLSELLLIQGYDVDGVIRRASTNNVHERLSGLVHRSKFKIIEGDITDYSSVSEIVHDSSPDEIYNLAAQSHVGTSFKQPAATWNINALGVQNILESIRKQTPRTKFYQASTSEMFGSVIDSDGFQRETTELSPNSPYAVAKVAAHHTVRLYREAYNMYACSGILFNHESPRRGENFVTRKITKWIGGFKNWLTSNNIHPTNIRIDGDNIITNRFYISGFQPKYPRLRLGNLESQRDWGFAGDYVVAMQLMLQQEKPDDYVISTGETHSVREFLDVAFRYIGVVDWNNLIVIDPEFIRPYEVPVLKGDSSKAREKLGWKPTVDFHSLVKMMVTADG